MIFPSLKNIALIHDDDDNDDGMDYSSEPLWTPWGHDETFFVTFPYLKNIARSEVQLFDDEDDGIYYLLARLSGATMRPFV